MIADKNSDSFSINRTIMAIASISMTFFSFFMTIQFFVPANFNPFVFDHFVCDLKTYYFECLDYPGYILRELGMESLEILLFMEEENN